jgi:hypothetical protein
MASAGHSGAWPGDGEIRLALARERQRKANSEKWCDCDARTLTHVLLSLYGREWPGLHPGRMT